MTFLHDEERFVLVLQDNKLFRWPKRSLLLTTAKGGGLYMRCSKVTWLTIHLFLGGKLVEYSQLRMRKYMQRLRLTHI